MPQPEVRRSAGHSGDGAGAADDRTARDPALPLDALRAPVEVSDPVRVALARLGALLRLEREDLWVIVIYAVATGALALATPIAVQALVNTVAFGSLIQPLVVLAALLFAGLAAAAVLEALAACVVELVQQRLFVRAVADLGRRLPRVELSAFDGEHGPELVNRFFAVMSAQKAGAALLLDGVALALQAVVGMLLLAFYHPLLLALDVVLLVALAAIVLVPLRTAVRTSIEESQAKFATAAWLEELARAPAVFKSGAGAAAAAARSEVLALRYLRARRAHFARVLVQLGGGLGLQVFAGVALLGVGGLLVIKRQLTLGQLVAAELVVAAVSKSFVKLGKHLESFYDLVASVHKIGILVDLPLEAVHDGRPAGTGPASVRLREVACELGDGRPGLRDLDLEIAAGERVHLDARRGADPGVLLELCAGLRRPSRGAVEIDGLDLRACDLFAVRDEVMLVRPEQVVAGTVRENLGLGAADVTDTGFRAALAIVGLDAAIAALPDGEHTELCPGGAPLTRPQARRLTLARALAAHPRLLLVDGGLDGLDLDPLAHARLLDHVFDSSAPWTLLVITDDPLVRARCSRGVVVTT